MERKDFIKNGFGLIGLSAVIVEACKNDVIGATGSKTGSCVITPTEEEGPFPYPGGGPSNPLQRIDIPGGQTGIPVTSFVHR